MGNDTESAPPVKHSIYHDQVAEVAKGGQVEDLPPSYYYSPNFIGTIVAACAAYLSQFCGFVLPANTLALINAELDNSPNIIWVALVWAVASSVAFTLVGRLSDIFGRRWIFITFNALGLIGAIVGATANRVNTLIAASTINGFAAAGQLTFPVFVAELVPNRARGPINSAIIFSTVPFAAFGPVIARAFIVNTAQSWRWSYFLGIIINSVALIFFLFFYWPPTYDHLHVNGKTRLEQIKTIDYIGIFLFTAGIVLFLLGISWGGPVYPWKSDEVICGIVIGALTLVAFIFWEAYYQFEYPLLPIHLFLNIQWDAIVVCATVGAMAFYSMLIIWPAVVSALYTTDIIESGWLSCAVPGGLVAGQLLGGLGIRYIPLMKIQMTAGAIVVTTFVAALASVNQDNRQQSVAFLLLATIGVGYTESLVLTSVALVTDQEDIGLSYGMMSSVRNAGAAIATAIYSAVLTNKVGKYYPEYVSAAALGAGLPESSLQELFGGLTTGNFTAVDGITPAIEIAVGTAVKSAYSDSFKVVFLVSIAFGACFVVAALMTPNVETRLTGEVARKLVKGQLLPVKKDEESRLPEVTTEVVDIEEKSG